MRKQGKEDESDETRMMTRNMRRQEDNLDHREEGDDEDSESDTKEIIMRALPSE